MGARTVSSDEEEVEEREEEEVEDNEAAVDEDDDEDEDEEGQDEYEKDDFIVDDVEEEEEAAASSDEETKIKKKKRKKRDAEENYELDEDDYELLQEANVTGFHRPKSQASKTKFKRLKKAGRITGEDAVGAQTGFSDDEDLQEGNRHGRTAEEKLERTLFGDDEGAPPEDIGEEEEAEEEEEDLGDDDEMADFIVDEEEVDENGQRVRRKKPRKRGPRQAAGISSMALQEAQEIFGDVTELLDRRKLGMPAEHVDDDDEGLDEEGGYPSGRSRKKKLEEEFEPSVLEEKYMTDRDYRIRETDVPERLQLLEEITGVVPVKESKLREAEWIYEQAFGYMAERTRREFRYLVNMDKAEIVKQINFVLTQLQDQKFEVPFIGMYRKEGCLDLLGDKGGAAIRRLNDFKVLWQIFSMDKKWWLLKRRKDVLQKAYEACSRIESRKDATKLEMLKSHINALQEAQTELSVDDVDAKYSLHFPADEVEVHAGPKRPKRRSFYSVCRKTGLNAVSRHFGLTPEQFGENLQAMYKRHEVEDSSSTPEDIAAEFHAGEFTDPHSVLRGARHMAAAEISTEPAVRDYVRNIFAEKAVVNTKPSKEGNGVIDSYHRYATVKWLCDKPVSEFNNGQWLLLQKANEEKLLEVTVGLSKDVINNILMQEFETQYLSEGVSRTAQLWNEQRKQILEEAVTSMLLPLMEKETKMSLTNRAKQYVEWEYGAELWRRVSFAPYSLAKPDAEDRTEEDHAPRVLACCGGSTNSPTAFVILDSAGEIVNTLYAPYIGSRKKVPEIEERKKKDIERLLKFLIEYQPHVGVVGAANMSSKNLKNDVHEAIFKLVEQFPRDMPDNVGDTVEVYFGDEAVPRIYEASQVSTEQLPGQPGIIRRAVALGRNMQNPLAMVSSLCGPNREILSLKLHPLESFLTDDEKYDVVEQVMVTVTNQVGVDVNLAAVHEWMFSPLQFVAGLGARKASMMQRFIQGVGRISTRKELFMSLRLMKKNVFMNSCGFLRIRGSGQAASGNQIMDPLDDTRVHPESYDLAKKMAETLYRHENDEEVDDEMLEMALEHVRENPNLIKNLDIQEYASMVQESEGIWKLETLKDIQLELLHGYQDMRDRFAALGQDEEFSLLTGEDEETLCEGKVVSARVIAIKKAIHCKLENGLDGFIEPEDFSDDRNVDISERVSVGSFITCRVKSVRKSNFALDLTCKSSDLQHDDWGRIQSEESYFRLDLAKKLAEQESAKKEKEKQKSFKPRMIVHPQFQNLSMVDAIEALAEKDVGEIIIRPSSKGPTHLSITLKFFDGVYTHIDIVEGGKDSKDFASFLSLGKTLKIADDTFEDLDEVIARYVDPLVTNLKEMLRYRKFRRGNKEEVDSNLRREKSTNPLRIVYCFSVSFEHPGAFMLSYLKNVNIHHEYISLNPKGYRFRKRVFENIDKLVNYFQRHVNDPVENPPSMRSLAAMVPMKSPAPLGMGGREAGGSERPNTAVAGGGWDTDGWNSSKEVGNEKVWEPAATPDLKTSATNDWSSRDSGGYGKEDDGWNDNSGGGGDDWGKVSSGGGGGTDDWGKVSSSGGGGADDWGRVSSSGGGGTDDWGRATARSDSWRSGDQGRGGTNGGGRGRGRGDGFRGHFGGGGKGGRGYRGGHNDGFGGRWGAPGERIGTGGFPGKDGGVRGDGGWLEGQDGDGWGQINVSQ